ncbi:MAG: tRNA 2-selenouridine(34) synthase MnmH [Lentisphaeraceae bacterium]|nr:tRNA 2-selenouridine(34) synthase MnmH [Lentisphaeraceae bacterium]
MADQKEELKTIIEKIHSYELPEIDIQELIKPCPSISWPEFSPILQSVNNYESNYCILDVRSEGEFEESAIPCSHNIPLFDNEERHNVGLLFKQQSVSLAEQVGAYYAYKKEKKFLKEIKDWSDGKKIIVHCWRGGYRSKATTALLVNNGFDAVRLDGGHKAFRRAVHNLLYETPLDLISLSGQTGTGKSEILEYLQKNHPEIPVLHIEEAANHASSVFGTSRFEGDPVNSQQRFETRLYMQLIKYRNKDGSFPPFITEKESSRIGRVVIPNGILEELKKEKHIRVDSTVKTRVKRSFHEYVEGADSAKLEQLREQIQFLKRYLGNEVLEEYLTLFDNREWDSLLKKVLVNYYDKVYRKSAIPPIAEVSNENTKDAVAEILKIYSKLNSK